MASIQRRNNKWRAIVRKGGINCSATFKTKAQAIQWAKETEADIARNPKYGIPDLPFSYLINKYLRKVTPQKRSRRNETQRLYRLLELIKSYLLGAAPSA